MILRGAAISLSCFLISGPVLAEGWTIKDLGGTPSEEACVDLAWEVFNRSAKKVADLQRSSWVVYGYDLTHNDFDAVITCSFGPDDTTRATLVVYSAGNADSVTRKNIADQLEGYWEEMK